MKRFHCVLLDMGKVLVNFDFRIFADRMRALTGLEAEQLCAVIMGKDLARHYECGRIDDREFHAEICRRIGRGIPFTIFAEAWNSIFLPTPLLPDELLSALAIKAKLWILSNTNRLHFDFINQRYSFVRYFEGSIVSYEAGAAKPDQLIFQHALCRTGAQAAETLFVDDTMPNVEAALGMGMDAFQYTGVEQFTRELKARDLL